KAKHEAAGHNCFAQLRTVLEICVLGVLLRTQILQREHSKTNVFLIENTNVANCILAFVRTEEVMRASNLEFFENSAVVQSQEFWRNLSIPKEENDLLFYNDTSKVKDDTDRNL
ncbi:4748_t:CDS:2, partial [Ambispora gerdemannii]